MGFGETLRMEWMRANTPLTQALRSRWDAEATAFILPWGHMIPNLEDVSRITGLRLYGQPEVLADEPGVQADLDLRRFLILLFGRLLFATRGDPVHCRFFPLLEDLGEVGGYVWGAAFLVHQFESLGFSDRQTAISGFYPFLQVWAYLHLPGLRRGTLERPGLVPIARQWVPCRDTHPLGDHLASLEDAIDIYPQLDVVWRPYLEEGDEGQPWLVQARPYFGRSPALRQSAVEFPSRDVTPRLGQSFRGLHDTTDWRERAKEQIQNWERRGKQVKSTATSDDAYLQAFTLNSGQESTRAHDDRFRNELQVDVVGEIASLWALLHSAMQDREVAQREAEQLRRELDWVRRATEAGASSSRAVEGSQSDLEDRLAAVVRRAEEARVELAKRETELRTATDRATQLQG
ncbi:hypothetical protein Taro_038898 [Colocasia esculenta]|uniref:Aminotransferase-like plant mobile domain-containing protein n=1 Tax=Colocasia esculenta TaxID=4460 RepID=A0A843WF45_COLES|nr:hypothetical protein [Colocasia esculenta]